jgi:hypothetical protein
MSTVVTIPDSTKNSLHWHLADRARERWPDLTEVRMRYRAGFAYVDGVLADGQVLRLTTCPAAHSPAPPKRPSTAPEASTGRPHRLDA